MDVVPVRAWLPVAQVSETFLPSHQPITELFSSTRACGGFFPSPQAVGILTGGGAPASPLPQPPRQGPQGEGSLALGGLRGGISSMVVACLALVRALSPGRCWYSPGRHPRTVSLLIHLRSYLCSSCRVNRFWWPGLV